jgi:hypothetical protein
MEAVLRRPAFIVKPNLGLAWLIALGSGVFPLAGSVLGFLAMAAVFILERRTF